MLPTSHARLLAVVPVVAAVCAPSSGQSVDITAVDYAFGAPARVPPGPTTFRFINAGTVAHEVQFFLFKAGISADSGRALLAREHFPDSLADSSGAVLIAAARDTTPQQLLVVLHPGQLYALVCQFRDSAGAQRHDRMGMFAVLEVASAEPD